MTLLPKQVHALADGVAHQFSQWSFNTALGVRTESSLKFEIEFKNIILVPLRFSEFSHRLGP